MKSDVLDTERGCFPLTCAIEVFLFLLQDDAEWLTQYYQTAVLLHHHHHYYNSLSFPSPPQPGRRSLTFASCGLFPERLMRNPGGSRAGKEMSVEVMLAEGVLVRFTSMGRGQCLPVSRRKDSRLRSYGNLRSHRQTDTRTDTCTHTQRLGLLAWQLFLRSLSP